MMAKRSPRLKSTACFVFAALVAVVLVDAIDVIIGIQYDDEAQLYFMQTLHREENQ